MAEKKKRPGTRAKGGRKTAKKAGAKRTPSKKKTPPKKKAPSGQSAPRKAKPKTRRAAKKKSVGTAAGRKTKRRGARGAQFFDQARQILLKEREQIERRLDDLREELQGLEETPRELEEWAQEEKDRDILIRLEEREMDELRRIQAALSLVDSKQYGTCQVCGKPIPKTRLKELPTAFRCVNCTL